MKGTLQIRLGDESIDLGTEICGYFDINYDGEGGDGSLVGAMCTDKHQVICRQRKEKGR